MKGMQVSIVDTYQIETCRQGYIQLGFIVNFNKHIKGKVCGALRQLFQAHRVQGRYNQQDTISPDGASFCHLIGVNDEVLANNRQVTGRARLLEIFIAALKKMFVGQHRQAIGASCRILGSNTCRVKVFANQAFARRRFFDLGNHSRLLLIHALSQCAYETPPVVHGVARQLFLHGQADLLAVLLNLPLLAVEYFFQNRACAHLANPCVISASCCSFSSAAPLFSISCARATPAGRSSQRLAA